MYLLVAFAVAGDLTVLKIVAARDYSIAEASRPAYSDIAIIFTVIFVSMNGVIAVARMLAILTEMERVPHSHQGIP